jgi:glycosyltransferase involved in cell wall biosynthesis
MRCPIVSVIITTHNRFDFLCRAIDSVLSQTYKNVEIIVVDDCSSDGTGEKITRLYESIVYIRNNNNLGVSASRNLGIKAASGEYISFLDDDDEILPRKIESQVNLFLESENIDVVYCGHLKKYKNITVKKYAKLKDVIYPKSLDSCPNAINTILIKKSVFLSVGLFDENLNFHEDFDFWIRLSTNCIFAFIQECLAIYHIHGNQSTVNYKNAIAGIEFVLEKHKDLFYANKKYLYKHLRRQASKAAVNDDYSLFFDKILLAIKIRPFNFVTYIHLFISFLSQNLHKKLIHIFGVKKIDGIVRY